MAKKKMVACATLTALLCAGLCALPETAQAKRPMYAQIKVQVASADPTDLELAKRHFAAGVALYEKGTKDPKNYRAALEEFLKAKELAPSLWKFDYNVAKCHDRLENFDEAIGYYEGYLEHERNPIDRKDVEDRVKVLKARLTARKSVEAPPQVDLRPPVLPPPPPASPPSPPTHPSVADQAIAFGPPPPAPPAKSRKWLYAAIGTGAAAILAASIGGGYAANGISSYNELKASCHNVSCIEPAYGTAKAHAYGGYVGMGVGVALAVVDVPLIIRAVREAREQSNPQPPDTGTR